MYDKNRQKCKHQHYGKLAATAIIEFLFCAEV